MNQSNWVFIFVSGLCTISQVCCDFSVVPFRTYIQNTEPNDHFIRRQGTIYGPWLPGSNSVPSQEQTLCLSVEAVQVFAAVISHHRHQELALCCSLTSTTTSSGRDSDSETLLAGLAISVLSHASRWSESARKKAESARRPLTLMPGKRTGYMRSRVESILWPWRYSRNWRCW